MSEDGVRGGCLTDSYRATLTSGGTTGNKGSFGTGGSATTSGSNYKYGSGGGGGGWYGGAACSQYSDSSTAYRQYNGGGSSYVYTEESAYLYPSGCLLNENYYLTAAHVLSGVYGEYDEEDNLMWVGNAGNGSCRITFLSLDGDITGEFLFEEDSLERVYLGDTQIEKAFLGESQIFPALPTLVEYIQSDGIGYIDTGVIPDTNTKVKAQFELVNEVGQQTYTGMFGCQTDASNSYGFTLTCIPQDSSVVGFKTGNGSYMSSTLRATSEELYTVECSFNKFIINGTTYTGTSTWSALDESIYIFGRNAGGEFQVDTGVSGRIYYFEIYDGDTLIKNFLPAIDPEGRTGLYETVERKNVLYVSRNCSSSRR